MLEGERALFTGDVILGTGTVAVAPPNGDMRAYQRTLHRLRDDYGDASVIYGGHGPEVLDARAKIDEYIAHRERREAQISAALAADRRRFRRWWTTIYRDVDRRLWPAAARQILAYLVALEREGRVSVGHSPSARRIADERAILTSPFRSAGDPATASLMRAELGEDAAPPVLRRYALAA